MNEVLTIGKIYYKEWKNKNNTSERSDCNCGTWKHHWEKLSGDKWPSECSVEKCRNEPEVGAHVICEDDISGEYIVPLCKACNGKRDEVFRLKSGTVLVTANLSKSCDR